MPFKVLKSRKWLTGIFFPQCGLITATRDIWSIVILPRCFLYSVLHIIGSIIIEVNDTLFIYIRACVWDFPLLFQAYCSIIPSLFLSYQYRQLQFPELRLHLTFLSDQVNSKRDLLCQEEGVLSKPRSPCQYRQLQFPVEDIYSWDQFYYKKDLFCQEEGVLSNLYIEFSLNLEWFLRWFMTPTPSRSKGSHTYDTQIRAWLEN